MFTSTEVIYLKTVDIKQDIHDYLEKVKRETDPISREYHRILQLKKSIDVDFKSYFVLRNSKIDININDNFDIAVQISNKLELDLFSELYETFSKNDVNTLFKIALKKAEISEHKKSRKDKKLVQTLIEECKELET